MASELPIASIDIFSPKRLIKAYVIVIAVILTSCATSKEIVYFQDEPIYYNKRQSMIKSQECIQDMPDLPSELPDPGLDAANGNTIYGYHSTMPLETTM